MFPKLKKLVYSFSFLLFLFGLARLYYALTDDIRISNMIYEYPFQNHWESPTQTKDEYERLKEAVSQDYFYIGKGAQSYAFESRDKQYVLKFFKFKHLKPNWFIQHLPDISFLKEFKNKYQARKNRKLIGVFNGYDLAYREDRDHSALLYVHLVPTEHLNLNATIHDKMGFQRVIPLDPIVFLIQKKGETLRSHLNQHLKLGHLSQAKESISKIIDMYVTEYERGIYDHDHGVMQNTGFIGQEPFHLDVGKLHKDPRIQEKNIYKKDLKYVLWKISYWFKKSYPEYFHEINLHLQQKYSDLIGEVVDFTKIDSKEFKKDPI